MKSRGCVKAGAPLSKKVSCVSSDCILMKIEEAFVVRLEVETQNCLSVRGVVMRKEVMWSCYHYTQSGTHVIWWWCGEGEGCIIMQPLCSAWGWGQRCHPCQDRLIWRLWEVDEHVSYGRAGKISTYLLRGWSWVHRRVQEYNPGWGLCTEKVSNLDKRCLFWKKI